jgi:hypothetical protein
VISVVVRVDEVGDLVAHAVRVRDLVNRALKVMTDGRRRIEQDHPVRRRQEGGLVGAVGDPVEVPLDASHVVPQLVDGRAQRRLRNGCVDGKSLGLLLGILGKGFSSQHGAQSRQHGPRGSELEDLPPGDGAPGIGKMLGLGGIDRELRAHGSLLSGRSWVAPPTREIALGSPKIAGGHSSTEGVGARFDPHREWGAIASPISLVRVVGEGP